MRSAVADRAIAQRLFGKLLLFFFVLWADGRQR